MDTWEMVTIYLQELIQVGKKREKLVIRRYGVQDFKALIDIQKECFPPPFPAHLLWTIEQLREHVTRFPEGAVCAEIDGRLIGSMTTLITQYNKGDLHSWSEVTDNGSIRNHNPKGNSLYVVDISVRPSYRSIGIGRRLLQAMYYGVIELGLERLLGGGRMPGYSTWSDSITPEEYLEGVLQGEIGDPVISFMLNNGRIPYGVIHNYLDDEESGNCAALMAWENPFLKKGCE